MNLAVVAEAKAAADAALAAAQAADDRAANARQMVLNDRERNAETIAPLKAAAAQFGSVTAAADAIHAELAERIAAASGRIDGLSTDLTTEVQARAAADEALSNRMNALSLTPGKDGASAYDLARSNGYGGTTTQWLASLKGVDGQSVKGDKGEAGSSGTANLAIGVRPIPLLALGGNTSVVLPLSRALPTNTYRVEAAHSAVVDLTKVTLEVTTKTTSSVTVKVTATGLALAAGTLVVVAVAP